MRKVLVVTYYWPPAGGPGVQRWLKFVKYLPEFEVEPIVYIPENPNYPITDTTLEKEVSENLKIYSHPIKEPYGFARLLSSKKTKRISSGIIQGKNQSFIEKLMLWVRGNFFIPDARKNWVRPSVKFLSEVIRQERIKCVVTTGPPHSVHLIGKQLKEKHQLKWVADFRDPWTSIGYHKKLKLTKSSRKKHKQMESAVLNSADSVVVTSNTTRKEFEQLTSKPITVITNGYDIDVASTDELDAKFTISHIGSLLTGRNPSNLWAALSELVLENKAFHDAFELKLVGVVSEDVLDNIYGHGLHAHTSLVDYLTHEDAVAFQRRSQVLLLVEINSEDTVGIIPGKVFEYIAVKRPILGIGPKNWEVAEVLSETQSGLVFDYEARSALKTTILKWFNAYQNGQLQVHSENISNYSRRELTRKLVEIL